jgi:Spy/CpxP family protein refolding chaperone
MFGLVPTSQAGRGGAGPGGAFGGGRGGPPGGDEAAVLNNRQQQIFQDTLQGDNDRLRALEIKLHVAQRELLMASLASKFDGKIVQGKAQAVADIQADMAALRAKGLAAVGRTMTALEKQQLASSPSAPAILGGGPSPDAGPGGFAGGPGGGFPGGGPGGFAGGGRGGGPGGGPGGPGGFPGGGPGGGSGGILALDAQQQQAFQESLQKDSIRMRGMTVSLRYAENDLVDATLASKFDEKTIREKAETVTGIETAMAVLRVKALAAALQETKPEEKQRLAESPAALQIFTDSNFGGGPGAGRGGRGGGRGGFPGGGGDGAVKER